MKRLLLSALIGLSVTTGLDASSIFAPLGMGINVRQGSTRSIGIAGADAILADSVYFPLNNPAGWFNVGYTRYTASMNAVKLTGKDGTGTDVSDDFGFPNMAFAMPLYRSLGLGFAFEGVTDHEYLVFQRETLTPIGGDSLYTVTRRVQGGGGLARVSANVGARIRPWLAVGVGVRYYFGKTERLYTLDFEDSQFYRSGEFLRHDFSGVGLSLGSIAELGKQWQLGGSLDLPTTLRVNTTLVVQGGDSLGLGKSNYGLPFGGRFGGAWSSERHRFSGQGSFALWNLTERKYGADDPYTLETDFAIGYERLPSRAPLEPWYQRWIFRGGAHIAQYGIEVGGEPVRIIGLAMGMGIPLRTHPGVFDLAFTLDFRGSANQNGASERVIGLQLGFNSAERWFVRRQR